MKRLLLLLALCLLISPALGTAYTMNERSEYFRLTNYSSAPLVLTSGHYVDATKQLGVARFIKTTAFGTDYAFVRLGNAYPVEYSAATEFKKTATVSVVVQVRLYNQNMALLDTCAWETLAGSNQQNRYEMKMLAGVPQYWRNGVLTTTGPLLSGNPAFVSWGVSDSTAVLDPLDLKDINWAEPNRMMMTLPGTDNDTFIIVKDIINPAASGIAFGENGTIIDSNYMKGYWSRGNASTDSPLDTQPNWTIQLKNYGTGVVYAENYTGISASSGKLAFTGNLSWNIRDLLIENATAPQGYYGLYCPETLDWSNLILYKSNGATVAFDSDTYSTGDTATVITYVASGGYWDTSLYSYKVSILDSYMNFIQNTTLTSSSGSVTYDWTEDNAEGVYHAWLIATNHNGNEYVLGTDYTELVAYFGYGGTVHDCITELPLSGANVNVTQGLTGLYNGTSDANGNYTTGPLFTTGSSVFFNVTMSGYNPYQYSFVPLSSGTIRDLNLTICPTIGTGDVGILGIGGVVRDATIGRPIQGANVSLYNQTNAQQYFQLTNMAGGYVCDAGTSCTLVSGRLYQVNASKVGYNTSVDYPVVAGSA